MRAPWWYGVACSALAWLLGTVVVFGAPESALAGTAGDALFGVLLVAWLVMPVALVRDRGASAKAESFSARAACVGV